MTSNDLNAEKLKLLLSGVVDGEEFKKKLRQIRKKLGIPSRGLKTIDESQAWCKAATIKQDEIMTDPKWIARVYALDKNDPEYEAKYRSLHKEAPINFLTYSVDELMEEYQDLNANLRDSVHDYILFNSISAPSNSRVYSNYNGDRHVVGVEVFGYMTDEEMDSSFVFLKELARSSFPRVTPLSDLDQDLKILKLSKKKGSIVNSTMPDLEKDLKYSDADIVSAVLPETADTKGNSKKNRSLMRQRRSRTNKRIEKHFPKISKKRRDS